MTHVQDGELGQSTNLFLGSLVASNGNKTPITSRRTKGFVRRRLGGVIGERGFELPGLGTQQQTLWPVPWSLQPSALEFSAPFRFLGGRKSDWLFEMMTLL